MANPATDRTAQVRFFDGQKPGQQPSVWLEIDGIKKPFVLMQYSSTFAKNEVPTATCILGTGSPVSESKDNAIPEQLASDLNGAILTKAYVYIAFGKGSQWVPPAAGNVLWGEEKTCIFEGYYAGLSYSRVGSQIQLSVTLVHRLIDLTFGSLLTGWMHPSNPSSLLQPAVATPMGACELADEAAGGGGEKGAWTAGSFLKDAVADKPSEFGDALLATLQCMTQMDIFKLDCADLHIPRNPNEIVGQLLNNCVSKTGGLRGPNLTNPAFLGAIGSYLGRMIDTNQGTTYWDLLINKLCPDFVMAVIPLPSLFTSPNQAYAFLVPDTPGLKTPYKKLFLGDYTGFSLQAKLWKPLYAVGVYSDGTDIAGSELHGNTQIPRRGSKCVGGMFPHPADPSLKDQLGQFLLVGAPEWLKDVNLRTGILGTMGDTNEAAHDAMAAEEELPPGDFEPGELDPQRADIMHDYARLIYVQNAINGRGGSFDSKLRFDIAPGSIVELDKGMDPAVTKNKAAGAYKELPGNVVVQVSRVSHNINAESPMAKTTFQCVHLRTKEELINDKIGRYSIDNHVFLDGKYLGAPMIENWKF